MFAKVFASNLVLNIPSMCGAFPAQLKCYPVGIRPFMFIFGDLSHLLIFQKKKKQ